MNVGRYGKRPDDKKRGEEIANVSYPVPDDGADRFDLGRPFVGIIKQGSDEIEELREQKQ